MGTHTRRAHKRSVNGKLVDVRETEVFKVEAISDVTETSRGRAFQTNCPHCGERVYFLKSANGGRAWFSALGHGWPKHACFTRGQGYGGPTEGECEDLFSDVTSERRVHG